MICTILPAALATLRSVSYTHLILCFTNEDLEKGDYILNVQNGTLDLSGHEPMFIRHTPDMLLSKICNVEYDPAAKCPVWEKFLEDTMQGNGGKIQYLQKIAGLSLTGNTEQETCFILYAPSTRNGKSTFVETGGSQATVARRTRSMSSNCCLRPCPFWNAAGTMVRSASFRSYRI